MESCNPTSTDVILVTGGVVPGFIPAVSSPHTTNTTEVLGSYCHIPNLPCPEYDGDDGLFGAEPGHISVLTPDGVLFACGFSDIASCYSLDLASQMWVLHSDLPMVFSDWGASAVVLDDGVYMMGFLSIFCQGDCTYNYYLYLPVGSTWWQEKPLSEDLSLYVTMGSCTVATSPWTFLVIGSSYNCELQAASYQVLEYNSRNSSWSLWQPLIEARYGHACTMLSDEIFIAGGQDPQDSSTGQDLVAYNTTTILNIKTRVERRGGEMLTGRAFFGLITTRFLPWGEVLAFLMMVPMEICSLKSGRKKARPGLPLTT